MTTTQNSIFVERWAATEQMNAKLAAALVTMTVVCISLAGCLVYAALRPRPIYYVPGAWDAGIAMPQSLPQAAVANFVSSWVLNWGNFTPATIREVYKRAQRVMSPALLAQTQARLDKDIEEVKRNNISSLFSITEDAKVVPDKNGIQVSLKGDKGIFMGKEEIKIQHMVYRIKVRTVNPTENNPYGLMIEAIEEEELL